MIRILGLWLVLALVAGVLIGETQIDIAHAINAPHSADGIIAWQIRLPRSVLAALVGLALGLSGAALQGLTRNPLADPGVLGVSACAGLGAATAVTLGVAGLYGVSLAACAGSLMAVVLLLGAAGVFQRITALVLFGVGLSSLAGAGTALVFNLSPNPMATADILGWMMGSVANRDMRHVALMAVATAVGVTLIAAARRDLRLLALGPEVASSMGASLRRLNVLVLLGTAVLTGASVAVAGVVGFVGLAAAHVVRPFTGGDAARTLWPAGLAGGVMVTLADVLVRVIPSDQELKLGVITALIGAPVLIVFAARLARAGWDA